MKTHLFIGRLLVLPVALLALVGPAFSQATGKAPAELPAELAADLGLTKKDGNWFYRRQSCSGQTPEPSLLQEGEVAELGGFLEKFAALPEAQRQESLMAELDRELLKDHDAAKYGHPRDVFLYYEKKAPSGHALTKCGKTMLPGVWLKDAWGSRFRQKSDDASVSEVPEIGKGLALPSSLTMDFDGRSTGEAVMSRENEPYQPELLVMGRMGRLDGRSLRGGGAMVRVPVAESSWGSIGADFGVLYNKVRGGSRVLSGGQEDWDDHNNQSGHGHENENGQGHRKGTHYWEKSESSHDMTIVQLAALYYRTPNLIPSIGDFSLEAGGRLGYGWSKAGKTVTRDTYEPRWDNDGRGHEQARITESYADTDKWSHLVPSAFVAATVAATRTFSIRGEVERMFLADKKDPWVFSLGGQLDF